MQDFSVPTCATKTAGHYDYASMSCTPAVTPWARNYGELLDKLSEKISDLSRTLTPEDKDEFMNDPSWTTAEAKEELRQRISAMERKLGASLPNPQCHPPKLKAHLGRSVAVTFHLIATPLGVTMRIRRRP